MDNNQNKHRIVVKIGTSSLTHENGHLNLRRIESLVIALSDLKNMGHEIVMVSSGAISAGVSKLGLSSRPDTTEGKQAAAAVGQTDLMNTYDHFFNRFGHKVAQILLTRDVIDNEIRLTSAQNTFEMLLKMGCIPIVNENDTISIDEIKFSGNDILSAYVSVMCHADLLVNLSDVDGMYTADPRKDPDAKLIERIEALSEQILSYAGGSGTKLGTGGMAAKLKAAQICCKSGCPMIITNGSKPELLYDIAQGKPVGTWIDTSIAQ